MFHKRDRTKGSNLPLWGIVGGTVAAGASLIPSLRRRAMRATAILKKDHRMVSGLFMTLRTIPRTNPALRKRVFDQIHHQLDVHTRVEEEIFYPAMRNLGVAEAQNELDEAYREHQAVKDLMGQISDIDPQSQEFDSKVRELKGRVAHHVAEEEGTMFEIARKYMPAQQLEQLGMRIHDRKRDLKQMAA